MFRIYLAFVKNGNSFLLEERFKNLRIIWTIIAGQCWHTLSFCNIKFIIHIFSEKVICLFYLYLIGKSDKRLIENWKIKNKKLTSNWNHMSHIKIKTQLINIELFFKNM